MILNAHQAAGRPAAPPTHCLLTLEDWELQETVGCRILCCPSFLGSDFRLTPFKGFSIQDVGTFWFRLKDEEGF